MRAVLGFEISFREIFTDDTEEEKLNTAYEHDNTDKAGPAGSRVAEGEGFHDDDENDDEGDETEKDTEEGGEGERDGREGDDAFDGIFEEFPERPFGFAGDTLDVFVFDPFGLEADESPEAFRIAVVFLTGNDGVDELAGHEAVITGAVDHLDFAHAIDELIEDAGAEAANGRFAFAGDAASGGAIPTLSIGGFGVDVFQELGEEAGRVLAVGVHGGDKITRCMLKTGKEGGFLAEVAREGNIENMRVFGGEGFHDGKGIVAAAVVDKNELEFVMREGIDDFQSFFVKEWERGGFVVTGDDNRDGFHVIIIT